LLEDGVNRGCAIERARYQLDTDLGQILLHHLGIFAETREMHDVDRHARSVVQCLTSSIQKRLGLCGIIGKCGKAAFAVRPADRARDRRPGDAA